MDGGDMRQWRMCVCGRGYEAVEDVRVWREGV